MKTNGIVILFLLFCACACYAQNSFQNPFSFTYSIESSSELNDSISKPESTKIKVCYDKNNTSICTILYNGEVKYCGRIIDMKLYNDYQIFILENFFQQCCNACLTIVRDSNLNNDQKIAMIYYANQDEDTAFEKTCICMFLTDI